MPTYSGKIIGLVLGLIFAGPMGALVGFILGHLHDRSPERLSSRRDGAWGEEASFRPELGSQTERTTYAIGVIVLGAKMAKADGRVSRQEIEAFKQVFRIQDVHAAEVGRIFDEARRSAEGFEPYAMRLSQVFQRNAFILEEILTGLFIVAASDSMGILSPAETQFLSQVATLFGFTLADFIRVAARSGVRLPEQAGAPSAKPAHDVNYDVLGLPQDATPEMIKKTYRALIRKHHPDKLMAEGLPKELVQQATEKMKRINAAYEGVARARGIK